MAVSMEQFYDAMTNEKGTFSIKEVAKHAQSCGVPTDSRHIFEWLREKEYICKNAGDWNDATKKCMDAGYMTLVVDFEAGDRTFHNVSRVTCKGLIKIINHMHDDLVVRPSMKDEVEKKQKELEE